MAPLTILQKLRGDALVLSVPSHKADSVSLDYFDDDNAAGILSLLPALCTLTARYLRNNKGCNSLPPYL